MALNKKGILLTYGTMAMLFAGTVGVSAYQDVRMEIMAEKEKREQEEAFIAQEREKQQALIKKYTATKKEYVAYAHDAEEISEMLISKKYSMKEKVVFFTFDNITSSEVAETIIKMFDEYNAKGTFFYTGSQVENVKSSITPVIEKLYSEGNSIGNRSYSDSYAKLFPNGRINIDNFMSEYAKTDKVLQSILGEEFKTRAYRCPGGSNSWKGISDFRKEYSQKESFGIIDWNVAPNTAKTGEEVAQKTIQASQNKDLVVVLVPKMDEKKMLEFLQTSMKWYSSNGYTFKSLG